MRLFIQVAICVLWSTISSAQSGNLDLSFGSEGIIKINNYPSNSRGIIVQNDGKLVISGEAFFNNRTYCFVCRLNPNGSFDNSFGDGGVLYFIPSDNQPSLSYSVPWDMALAPDNKIIITGEHS
jgi:hypothetical protein